MFFLVSALVAGATPSLPSSPSTVNAMMGSSGAWPFCQSSTDEKCTEEVVVTKPDGTAKVYTSSSSMQTDGVVGQISCTAMNGDCDSSTTTEQVAELAKTCNPAPNTNYLKSLFAQGGVLGHKDWSVRLTARTGSFEPAFSIGHGIIATAISPDPDGTWRYSVTLRPVVKTSATLPVDLQGPNSGTADGQKRIKEFLATAEATHAWVSAEAYVWSPTHLYRTGKPGTGCNFVRLNGMWATTNGTGVEFGLRERTATSGTSTYEFAFKVSAPHIIRRDMLDVESNSSGTPHTGSFTGEKIVNPADIRMYLPKQYGESLGYSDVGSIPKSALQVVTEDGQPANPFITPSPDGSGVLDFGISHFSAPNPSVSISPRTTATTASAATSAAAKTVTSIARRKSVSLARVMTTTKKGVRQWNATGQCRVSKSKLVASDRRGTCRVTLTVRNSSKKVVFRKTVTVKVT